MGLFRNRSQNENQEEADNAQTVQVGQNGSISQEALKAWAYSVVKRPLITEKTYKLAQQNVYTFKVHRDANKSQVKKALEIMFEVPVTKVRIVNIKPQAVMFQREEGQTRFVKKAMVSIADGYSINL